MEPGKLLYSLCKTVNITLEYNRTGMDHLATTDSFFYCRTFQRTEDDSAALWRSMVPPTFSAQYGNNRNFVYLSRKVVFIS